MSLLTVFLNCVLMTTLCNDNVVIMSIKDVITDSTIRERLDVTNYHILHRKIQYLFNELDVLETVMKPGEGDAIACRN